MVPEQTCQDQEVQRLQESASVAADGAGTVQPHHGRHVRRRDGRPSDGRVFVMSAGTVALNLPVGCTQCQSAVNSFSSKIIVRGSTRVPSDGTAHAV